jgi:6-phosphogluconolactonase
VSEAPPVGELEVTGEPEVVVMPDVEGSAHVAAERIATTLNDAIASRGRAHWATTGGSTPGGIYRHLADSPLRETVDWEHVELWWGDDRFVPRDHPLSNFKVAADVLLDFAALSGESGTGSYGIDVIGGRLSGAPIHATNVHPMPVTEAIGEGRDVEWCAARYAEMLLADGPPIEAGCPAFDLILLGIGPDGHVLSVFPNSAAFERPELAFGVPAPMHVEPHVARVTLNPAVLAAARAIVVVVQGESKAQVLAEILNGERQPRRLPGQLARRAGAVWIVDKAAARLL